VSFRGSNRGEKAGSESGRGGGIRTHDLLNPINQDGNPAESADSESASSRPRRRFRRRNCRSPAPLLNLPPPESMDIGAASSSAIVACRLPSVKAFWFPLESREGHDWSPCFPSRGSRVRVPFPAPSIALRSACIGRLGRALSLSRCIGADMEIVVQWYDRSRTHVSAQAQRLKTENVGVVAAYSMPAQAGSLFRACRKTRE
jgi:hypothetical protein